MTFQDSLMCLQKEIPIGVGLHTKILHTLVPASLDELQQAHHLRPLQESHKFFEDEVPLKEIMTTMEFRL